MISIKSTNKISLASQLETKEKYIMVSVRDLNISNENSKVTAIIVCYSFDYELDEEEVETDTMINKKQIEAKPITFTKTELNELMVGLNASITGIDSFDAFQLAILTYLANRDSYFGITEWETT
ncbi:hypothetical protein NBRC110019_20990 [Neptunitalea chrysea]|uniref:Uncharacterized protein n=1 Tax=Neptunitalea chrysea TaxID=1647581 RepID=A0A9W6EUV6_9FLAO|nr:hypothetical protein [Neptunitalea chrysea]GLB53059.1 hypothetical protein NBRC110019_20990 [Neptunitalea chrysea]